METDRQTDRHHETPWQSQQPRATPQHPLWIRTMGTSHPPDREGWDGGQGCPLHPQSPWQKSTSSCRESPSVLGPSGAGPPGTGGGTRGDSELCLSAVWPQLLLSPRSCCSLGPHPSFWGACHPTHPPWALQAPGALVGVALVGEPHSPLLPHPSHLSQRETLAPGPLSASMFGGVWGLWGVSPTF